MERTVGGPTDGCHAIYESTFLYGLACITTLAVDYQYSTCQRNNLGISCENKSTFRLLGGAVSK